MTEQFTLEQRRRYTAEVDLHEWLVFSSAGLVNGFSNQFFTRTRSGFMQGFIVGNYSKRFKEGIQPLATWIQEGKLHYTGTTLNGFDTLPEALPGLFSGQNTGKMIVEV